MKKKDIEFLKQLQHEMLTQDTVGQADPRFWVVMQTVKDYWVEDNTDGIFVSAKDSAETEFEDEWDKLAEWICSLDDVESSTYEDGKIHVNYNDSSYEIEDDYDLKKFLNDYNSGNYEVGYYRNRNEIVENTMFLTLRECKEHIEANRHHYNKPIPYAMTAWRSPQVEQLYKILQTANWDELKEGN